MAFTSIHDPKRLHSLIEAILLIESSTTNLNEMLGQIVETAASLVGAQYGALGIMSPGGKELISFITYGIDSEARLAIGPEPTGKGLLGETISQAQPIRVQNLGEHPQSSGFPAHHPPMQHFLGVPVRTGDGHVYGNLYLTDPLSGEDFSEDDVHLVDAFGRAAGIVIDHVTLRSQLRELTLSEERERLARELNDTVIEKLLTVEGALQSALNVASNDLERAPLRRALDELNGTLEKMRSAIFEIDQDHLAIGTLKASSLLSRDQLERTRERMAREEVENDRIESLSGQERRILELLSEGLTNREIASVMFLAEKTVKNYVSNVLAKLGFQRRTEAALFAARQFDKQSH